MATARPLLHLQYGVNAFADEIYKDYHPPQVTNHYPDPMASELRKAIAHYVGCEELMILCSSGSDELIDLYIRIHHMRVPGLKVAFAPPTYPQYELYGKRSGAELIYLPSDMSRIDAAWVKKFGGDPKDTVVMLDSPSNPSGQEVNREQFKDLLDAGFQVFADEAYFEFSGHTVADMVTGYPNQLVVSRSFSKFAAMSGSRVGYLIAMPPVIKEFRKHQLFFNVNTDGQQRALYALGHIADFHKAIETMHTAKQKVVAEIQKSGAYRLFPSLDMYTIFAHKRMPTEKLHAKLLSEHSIQTQRFPNFGSHDIIRTAVLRNLAMQRLTDALRTYA